MNECVCMCIRVVKSNMKWNENETCLESKNIRSYFWSTCGLKKNEDMNSGISWKHE